MSYFHSNSIFWIEVDKIQPNPYQPRREFDQHALNDLAESIRQYGVLQPLVVTRREEKIIDGGIRAQYELLAGERRLRAARLAGITQVPVIIRTAEENNREKLEIAIIENLQREDLNPVDRALAFQKLNQEFGMAHNEIGRKMGKSREYISNTLRLLQLPEEIRSGLAGKMITEGHTRPLLMLANKPDEQKTLYHEIINRRLSVRDAEMIARQTSPESVRKKDFATDPKIRNFEMSLTEHLGGASVHIEKKASGGKLVINYTDESLLNELIQRLSETKNPDEDDKLESVTTLIERPKRLVVGQDDATIRAEKHEEGSTKPQDKSLRGLLSQSAPDRVKDKENTNPTKTEGGSESNADTASQPTIRQDDVKNDDDNLFRKFLANRPERG